MSAPTAGLRAANRRGIVLLIAAMACLIANDTLMKQLGRSLPLAQMVFVRGLIATALVLVVVRLSGAMTRLGEARQAPVLQRAAADAVGTLLYLAALMQLPIADATAINLASPLVLALLAVLVLKERAGWGRWLAIVAGFAGVLLIVQPRGAQSGAGFGFWAWVCLAGTVVHAVRDLLTRRIHAATPGIVITLANAAMVTLAAGLVALAGPWKPLSAADLAGLAAAATLLAMGYHLIIASMRQGEITVIAPFRYAGLLMALVSGWLVFGELPNTLAWGGITLMAVAGAYLLHEGRQSSGG